MFLYDSDVILLVLLVIFLKYSYKFDWQRKIDPTIVFCGGIWKLIEDQSFEFQQLSFGDQSSPYLAQNVCRHHAESYAEIFHEAAKTIIGSMYMDDVMDFVTDIPTAIKLYRDLTELFALAGMRIHMWCSNETVVLEDLPEDDRVTDVHLENGQLPTIKNFGCSLAIQ